MKLTFQWVLILKFLTGFYTGVFSQAPAGDSTSLIKLRNMSAPVGRKIARSELLAGLTQVGSTGALLLVPREITHWSFDSAGYNFKRAWTQPPVFDHDSWLFNFAGHPYTGAFMYNTMRSQGAKPLPSFLFSTAQSLIWEYCLESWVEQPSIQDLIITSNVGSLLGEGIHRATLRMKRNGFSTAEKIFVIVANPAWWINNGLK